MDTNKLNKFSRLIYELFSVNFPELVQFTGNMPGHEDTLVIELASPFGAESKLKITTPNGEIALQFDHAHLLFTWSDAPTEAFYETRDVIHSILNEEWLAAAEMKDDKPKEAVLFPASQLDDIIRNNPLYNRIVGWNYTYLTGDDSEQIEV
jgi:hypothetical protein